MSDTGETDRGGVAKGAKDCQWSYGPVAGLTTQGAVVEFLPDNRRVRLLNVVKFRDRAGFVHQARPGLVSDGQSIPRRAWEEVDSPWTGPGREPALIHDQEWADADEMELEGFEGAADALRRAANLTFEQGIASKGGGRTKRMVALIGVWLGRLWEKWT